VVALVAVSLGVIAMAAWPARARDVVEDRQLPRHFEWVRTQDI
jgi:hypothetical protein